MTNMTHKPVDARRHRRTRHKRALKLIADRFGCTAMQASEVITSILRDNEDLRRKLDDANRCIAEQESEIAQLKDSLEYERATWADAKSLSSEQGLSAE